MSGYEPGGGHGHGHGHDGSTSSHHHTAYLRQHFSNNPSESQTTSSSREIEKTSDQAEPSSGSGSIRRPRGRPAGSKNKPKPPIVVTRDAPNSLKSHMLEILSGADITESLANYACQRGRGISIISGNGTVIDVTLKDPTDSNSVVTLNGRFEILSLTGTILPPPAPPGAGGLSIFLSGGQGQVVGGSVVGRLVAGGPVLLMAASFSNAVFERLPLEQEEDEEVHQRMHGSGQEGGSSGGAGGESNYRYPFPGGGGGGGGGSSGWGGNAPQPPF